MLKMYLICQNNGIRSECKYIYDKYISDRILHIVDCYFRHTLDSFSLLIYITEVVIVHQGLSAAPQVKIKMEWSHFLPRLSQIHPAYSHKTPNHCRNWCLLLSVVAMFIKFLQLWATHFKILVLGLNSCTIANAGAHTLYQSWIMN